MLVSDAQHSFRPVSGLPVPNSLCYYLLLSQSCVAQRQSIRLLIGRLLVRIQSQEPAPRRQSLRGFCLPNRPQRRTAPALSSHHYLRRRRHLGQPGAVESVQSGVVEPTQCSRARPAPLSGAVVGPKTKPRLPPKTGRQAGLKRFRWGWWCKPRSPTGW